MMHGQKDLLFPVPGYEEFERTVGKLYASYGGSEKFKNLVVDTAHKDSDLLRGEAVQWFDRWLKQIPEREIDLSYTDLPGEQLAVFAGSPPKDAQNYRVHRMLIPDPQPRSFATEAGLGGAPRRAAKGSEQAIAVSLVSGGTFGAECRRGTDRSAAGVRVAAV